MNNAVKMNEKNWSNFSLPHYNTRIAILKKTDEGGTFITVGETT